MPLPGNALIVASGAVLETNDRVVSSDLDVLCHKGHLSLPLPCSMLRHLLTDSKA